eukprot:tig00020704_g13213.t1
MTGRAACELNRGHPQAAGPSEGSPGPARAELEARRWRWLLGDRSRRRRCGVDHRRNVERGPLPRPRELRRRRGRRADGLRLYPPARLLPLAAGAAGAALRARDESQAVSESIGLLRTMRLYGGAGPPHADGALYRAPRTASAVQLSTSAAAAPSGTPTPVPDARRCPPPAAARRPPCPPPEAERFGRSLAAVKPRQSLDLGGLVRTRTRRLADLDPVKSRPRPIRKIIDDFPEMWRLARMDETVRTRSGYVPHEMLNELRGMFHKEYYIPVRNIFRYYAHLDGAKGRVPLPLPLLPLPLTRPAGVQVKAIAVRARHGDGEEMYTVNKRGTPPPRLPTAPACLPLT